VRVLIGGVRPAAPLTVSYLARLVCFLAAIAPLEDLRLGAALRLVVALVLRFPRDAWEAVVWTWAALGVGGVAAV
jgi:hypothetical protein